MARSDNPWPAGADHRPTRDFPELLAEPQWHGVLLEYGLTAQELNTLRLLCRGYSNAQLGHRLGIAQPTVRSHLRSLYQKLRQTGRMGAVLLIVHRRKRLGQSDQGGTVHFQALLCTHDTLRGGAVEQRGLTRGAARRSGG